MSDIASSAPDQCAACGKGGDGLKKCTACKLVNYCDALCQKSHRSKHKVGCRKRAAELHDELLFEKPPPREECPICFLPLPIKFAKQVYKACCGKTICHGCSHNMMIECGFGISKPILCPFCRAPKNVNSEEEMKSVYKRMAVNDAESFDNLAGAYDGGSSFFGLQLDHKKAFELWSRSAELGSINGHNSLGFAYMYQIGTKADMKKAEHHLEIAAMAGHVKARHTLGMYEIATGRGRTERRAWKHFMIAAKAGNADSLEGMSRAYSRGLITKEEFGETLQAHKESLDEMKSEQRTRADCEVLSKEEFEALSKEEVEETLRAYKESVK